MYSILSKKAWLFSYYIHALILSKAGKFLIRTQLGKYSNHWSEIFSHINSDAIVVVGNGPSLLAEDLEKLANHFPSIASNKIYLIFDQTAWRPNIWTICDTLLSYKLRKETFDKNSVIYCADSVYYMLGNSFDLKVPWRSITMHRAWKDYNDLGAFSPDPAKHGLFEGFSITVQNIQLAIWLGAKRVYLLGVDHFYEEEKNIHAGVKLSHSSSNHFDDKYRVKGEIVNNAPISMMEDAYEKLRVIAESKGVKIINISRKTNLKTFQSDSVEAIISSL